MINALPGLVAARLYATRDRAENAQSATNALPPTPVSRAWPRSLWPATAFCLALLALLTLALRATAAQPLPQPIPLPLPDFVAVSASRHKADGVTDQGAVYRYRRNGSAPTDFALIKMSTSTVAADRNHVGVALALDGDTLAVGA